MPQSIKLDPLEMEYLFVKKKKKNPMSGTIRTMGSLSLFCHKAWTFHLSRKNIENVNASKVENYVWNQITIIYM